MSESSNGLQDRIREAEVEARAIAISKNVRCTECGHQSIEDSQADIAVFLRKVIRDELRNGKTEKEIFDKLSSEYGETVLYAPPFDIQTAGLWLLPVICMGGAAAFSIYRQKRIHFNSNQMAKNFMDGYPFTAGERAKLEKIIRPPSSW